jgi:hypothetical protein
MPDAQSNANAWESSETGRVVTVFGVTASGDVFIEGRARIEAACAAPHYYRVRFEGEQVSRIRFIHPDSQHDPPNASAILNAFAPSNDAPTSFDDFFPDNNS